MRVVTDATLKVHTDAKTGSVWLIDGDGPPGDTGRDSERFAAELPPGPLTVRVLGFRENARLISSLYRRRPAHPGLSVEVGRPVVVPWEQLDGQGPEHVLFEIRQLAVQCPSSMGGWHALTDREYAGYALTALLNSGPADAHHVADLLGRHAAWPALSFITHLDLQATAQVLAEIGDPRWFIDPERPDSMSRLRSYFGLPPCGGREDVRQAGAPPRPPPARLGPALRRHPRAGGLPLAPREVPPLGRPRRAGDLAVFPGLPAPLVAGFALRRRGAQVRTGGRRGGPRPGAVHPRALLQEARGRLFVPPARGRRSLD
jgi:hypothetical protein